MGISYDALPEELKQKVCEDLLSRKKFYEDACVKIMEGFNNAVEVKGGWCGGGIELENMFDCCLESSCDNHGSMVKWTKRKFDELS